MVKRLDVPSWGRLRSQPQSHEPGAARPRRPGLSGAALERLRAEPSATPAGSSPRPGPFPPTPRLPRLGLDPARVEVDPRGGDLPGLVKLQAHDHRELDGLARRLPGPPAGP